MEKKLFFAPIFIFLVISVLFPFNLCSSQNKPGKRPLNYNGPQRARQTRPIAPSIQAPSATQIPQQPVIKEQGVPEGDNQDSINQDAPEEIVRVSDTKEAQINKPAPGWFASIYGAIAPLILVTMDKALGKGTTESTKSLIDNFITRRTFLNLKNNLIKEATEKVNSGEFDKTIRNNMPPKTKRYKSEDGTITTETTRPADAYINLPTQEKINLQTKALFQEHKIKDPVKLERKISISNIFAEAINIFVVNTAVNVLATFFGYGTKLGLNALMPEK